MVCPQCGAEVVAEAIFCHKCGHRIQVEQELQTSAAELENTDQATSPIEQFKAAASQVNTAEEQERELWRGGYSSRAMIGAWCLSAFVSIVLLIIGFWAWTKWMWIIVLITIVGFWAYNLVMLGYRRMSVRYLLTNQRFIHELGLLRRVIDRIEVIDMDDVSFEQGVFDRIACVGTIRLMSSDRTHPELVLYGIDNVREISGLFDDTRRAERRRRGLHIESI
jgi:hypothetical protein